MAIKRGTEIATETISRRDVVDWLGKGVAIALSSKLIAACGPAGALVGDGGGGDGGGGDGGGDGDAGRGEGGFDADSWPEASPGDDADVDLAGPGEFPFSPSQREGEIYEDWRVRTVDEQSLESVLSSWRLRVDGMVDNPFTLSFAELVGLERQDQVTDFHCVEGWSVYDVPWNGVHLWTLLDRAGPAPEATYITFHTIDSRYNESLPISVALEPRTLLAYGVDGYTLPFQHGFPLRLVVPRLLAYKSAKYVDRIELTDHPVEGYWVSVGYPYDGEVPEGRLRPGHY